MKKKYGLSFYVLLVMILTFIIFLANIIWGAIISRELYTNSKRVRYTYGYVYQIKSDRNGTLGVYACAILDDKKTIVVSSFNSNYVFSLGFYRIRYLCHRNNYAIIDWSSKPIDIFVANEYYKKNNRTSILGMSFQDVSRIANTTGGVISFIRIFKEMFENDKQCKCDNQ